MKICIWCRRDGSETNFKKVAHTVPKSIGGQNICENVCDQCNKYFGDYNNTLPSIETILKETFNITRARLLDAKGDIGRNKSLAKFSSIYFNVDFKNHKLSLKHGYRKTPNFQEKIGRTLKRGLYKIYLEENERQFQNSRNSKFDFIREFSRYDIGDYPVYYFTRVNGILPMVSKWIKHPELILDSKLKMKYLIEHPSFVEFEFLGHVISLTTSRSWELSLQSYLNETRRKKIGFFKAIKAVRHFNDIDLSLSILDS